MFSTGNDRLPVPGLYLIICKDKSSYRAFEWMIYYGSVYLDNMLVHTKSERQGKIMQADSLCLHVSQYISCFQLCSKLGYTDRILATRWIILCDCK